MKRMSFSSILVLLVNVAFSTKVTEEQLYNNLKSWEVDISLQITDLLGEVDAFRERTAVFDTKIVGQGQDDSLKLLTTSIDECGSLHLNTMRNSLGLLTRTTLLALPESAANVWRQMQFLETRSAPLKYSLLTEDKKFACTQSRLHRLEDNSMYDVMRVYRLVRGRVRGVLRQGSSGQDLESQSTRNWKGDILERRSPSHNVCLLNDLCAIQDITAVENNSLVGTFYFRNSVKHIGENGDILGQLSLPWTVRGISSLNGSHVIVGLPNVGRAIILSTIAPMRIVQEIILPSGCGVDFLKISDRYVVGCVRPDNIKFYDESWTLLKSVSVSTHINKYGNYYWLAYNQVSNMILTTNARVLGVSLDGDVIYNRWSPWFLIERPLGITTDHHGNWYAARLSRKVVLGYTIGGKPLYLVHPQRVWHPLEKGMGNTSYRHLVNTVVAKFSADGTFQGFIRNVPGARGLAVLPDGRLTIANEYGEIQIFGPNK